MLEFGDSNPIWSVPKSSRCDICGEAKFMRFFKRVYGGSKGIRPIGPVLGVRACPRGMNLFCYIYLYMYRI